MKKTWWILFQLIITLNGVAQNEVNPINRQDSLLNIYLSNRLDTVITGDTCFSGIYYIRFSVDENEKINNFSCSELMPLQYQLIIERSLKELAGNWNPSFLKLVTSSKRTIVQPIYIQTINECPVRENFYSKKLDSDSIGTLAFSHTLAKSTLILINNMLTSTMNTFEMSSNFGTDKQKYFDCLLMAPCIVVQKQKKPKRGKK